uniref:Beta-2-microglobulin n=2 Tax=Salmoninae TaxID=504568 RepID=A0A8K9WQJ5_ONCMY
MEEQEVVSGENKALRSLNADVETHVNFINQSKQSARAWWLDYSGHPVSYGDIRTNGLLRMDTFLTPPKVQVYSRNPGNFGDKNTLICHVSGFHPPDISIQLLKNGVEIPDAKQTDLAFEQGWQFHLTKSVGFTPASGEEYTCRVRHLKNLKTYTWEADM